ncbi:hypothetical protein CRUP_037416 [Coryphaenoides rupestris]|nr:hypothetical protein CRUP_037416 [Coryphaenoides rupestris]
MGAFVDRGVQMLLTTVGAFAAFSLMTIAVGTDYWLYSRGVCRSKSNNENETSKKNEEVMTHSGLWRTCCLEEQWLVLGQYWSWVCTAPGSVLVLGLYWSWVCTDPGSVLVLGVCTLYPHCIPLPSALLSRGGPHQWMASS